MTPEGKVKEQLKKMLRRFSNVYYHMPVMNGMGAPTLDFIICCEGRFLAVETKAPGKKPTPRQQVTMADMERAGAFVYAVSSQDDIDIVEATIVILGGLPHDETKTKSGSDGRTGLP